jgi:hypothetical protein
MLGSPTRLRSRPWALSRDLDGACVYAISRISGATSASTRIVKGSPIVAIGVCRRGVGRDNGPRRRTGDGAIFEVRQVCFKTAHLGVALLLAKLLH